MINLELDQKLLSLQLETLQTLQRSLHAIDPSSEDCLSDAIQIFAAANIEQKQLAKRLGVGPPTISRWATMAIRPRVLFRKGILSEMQAYMAELIRERGEKLDAISTASAERPRPRRHTSAPLPAAPRPR